MNDLDKKLEELLPTLHYGGPEDPGWDEEELAEAVRQVKQAFIDAGYVQVPTVNYEKVSDKLYIQNGMDKKVFIDGSDKRLMTGQDWYDKFITEMGDSATSCEGCSCDAIEDAKRAAGIE